jgi:hypothetical protein
MAGNSLTYLPGFLWNFSFSRFIPIMQIRHILIIEFKNNPLSHGLIYLCPLSCFCQLFYFWYLVQIINFLLIELSTILFAVWSETIGCIFFVCLGCAEHVLGNEVVRNTLCEQTEQCAGCTTFWGGAEGIKMAEPTIPFPPSLFN